MSGCIDSQHGLEVSGQPYSGEGAPRRPLDRRLGGHRPRIDEGTNRKFLIVPRFELRPLGRPVLSQSLHRLRHAARKERGRKKRKKEIKEKEGRNK
jgi:hypothetical protein